MSKAAPLILHGYWRSTASYRVRIALNLKGALYEQKTFDLRRGQHSSEVYRQLNPQALVPALDIGGRILTQSSAIIEWLDERYPVPPLLPPDPEGRAIVRAMAALVACDIHPLNNLRVLDTLRASLAASQPQVDNWIARWINDGFAALEILIAQHGKSFAYGDTPTLADCHLVPQVYSAERFKIDLNPFPKFRTVAARAVALPAFAAAHPSQQPDADAL